MPDIEKHILLLFSNRQVSQLLERVLTLSGFVISQASGQENARQLNKTFSPDMIIMDEQEGPHDPLVLIADLQRTMPVTPILFFLKKEQIDTVKSALRAGVSDCLVLPIRSEEFIKLVEYHLERARLRREHLLLETRRATTSLQLRLDEFETLTQLGRAIISSLELDQIFTDVVKAAVTLTGAEEGSLMLVDEDSGELYMRAALNFNDQFVRTFRLKVSDSIAGQVMQSGKTFLLDEHAPQKITTTYLVKTLIYVPLQLPDRIIGVLGVDNRSNQPSFKDHDRKLLEALAEYTAIAIHNAGLYADLTRHRYQLETTLTHIQDGVIVIDQEQHLILANQVARKIFKLDDESLGKTFGEVFKDIPCFLGLFNDDAVYSPEWVELEIDKDAIFSAQLALIPDVGKVITVHDISPLKKMDRIKSDFISTVSHDLRSPLTSILGYVDLLERAGPLNDMQRDFVRRVNISVRNITKLVDDLLELGRIEAGLDTHKELIPLNKLIDDSLETFKSQTNEKRLSVERLLVEPSPMLLVNPIYFRQMVNNLLENAIKFTPQGGHITLASEMVAGQAVLKVMDTGIGIPPLELPQIFEKFYRASNTDSDLIGTGLGLSIVRAVVEQHGGCVRVESSLGKGSSFLVSLPVHAPL